MSLLLVAIVFPVAMVLYLGFEKWEQLKKTEQFSKLHGCQPAPKEDHYDFFGIKKIISATQNLLNKTALTNTSICSKSMGRLTSPLSSDRESL